ncbi:MAG: hypothetical protein NZ519_06165 [Bacteroidia bacterium]|nr:hypothetical protein [Bacteroidia bacterium]MDW8301231.1 hypothetical protein [Bacteroidia bacterium]
MIIWILISSVISAVQAQQTKKEKPRPFTQIKINDFFSLDNIEFVCLGTLQYGEIIIGDTLDVYTPQGFVGKCRILELENPFTEEKLTIRHAPASLKLSAKAFNCIINEQSYLVTQGKLPYGVKIAQSPKKAPKDTIKAYGSNPKSP